MRYIMLSLAAGALFALSGCGGGSSSTSEESAVDKLNKYQAILIIRGGNEAYCQIALNELKIDETNDILYVPMPSSVSCATFGRTVTPDPTYETPNVCLEESYYDGIDSSSGMDPTLYEDPENACVFGMNPPSM